MKLRKLIAGLCFLSLSTSAFALTQEEITEVKTDLSSAITSMSKNILGEFEQILPTSNSLLGVQPDAFIGKIFPSAPPHFTIGINASVTPVSVDFLSNNLDNISNVIKRLNNSGDFSFELPFSGKLPYPAAAVNARIGGFFLPFDIGISAITTASIFNDKSLGSFDFDFSYTSIGADLRYAILEGKGLLPKISLGAGYLFVRQQLGLGISNNFTTSISDSAHPEYSANASVDLAANMNMNIDTHTIFGQLQVSKTLLIFTPYLGLKALFTSANCSYDWKYETKVNGDYYDKLSDSASQSYKDSISDIGIQTQIFGGFSLNIFMFQTSFNAAYNFSTKMFTGSLGMNFKM